MRTPKRTYCHGSLTEDDVKELYDMVTEAEEADRCRLEV